MGSGNFLISIGDFEILDLKECDPRLSLEALKDTWGELKVDAQMVELKEEVWPALEKARQSVCRELDILILRKVFPGNCRICPR